MSREIKFRAWHKKEKKMYEVWHWNFNEKMIRLEPNLGFWNSGDLEVMQYTGLKDKNGKEIYEMDIVKRFDEAGVVKWDELEARFRIHMFTNKPMPRNYPVSNVLDLEVIGNIYENDGSWEAPE